MKWQAKIRGAFCENDPDLVACCKNDPDLVIKLVSEILEEELWQSKVRENAARRRIFWSFVRGGISAWREHFRRKKAWRLALMADDDFNVRMQTKRGRELMG